jgi:hypothetical protein
MTDLQFRRYRGLLKQAQALSPAAERALVNAGYGTSGLSMLYGPKPPAIKMPTGPEPSFWKSVLKTGIGIADNPLAYARESLNGARELISGRPVAKPGVMQGPANRSSQTLDYVQGAVNPSGFLARKMVPSLDYLSPAGVRSFFGIGTKGPSALSNYAGAGMDYLGAKWRGDDKMLNRSRDLLSRAWSAPYESAMRQSAPYRYGLAGYAEDTMSQPDLLKATQPLEYIKQRIKAPTPEPRYTNVEPRGEWRPHQQPLPLDTSNWGGRMQQARKQIKIGDPIPQAFQPAGSGYAPQ